MYKCVLPLLIEPPFKRDGIGPKKAGAFGGSNYVMQKCGIYYIYTTKCRILQIFGDIFLDIKNKRTKRRYYGCAAVKMLLYTYNNIIIR
jgi:hypothetical protein